MSELRENLRREFQDREYRYAYAESFLKTKLAAQIKILREQREKTQAQVAAEIGTKQSGYSRFEDVNHSVWKTDSLWKIAGALGVRLNISFETFGTLIEEKETFNRENLQRPTFEDDPGMLQGRPLPAPKLQDAAIRRSGSMDPHSFGIGAIDADTNASLPRLRPSNLVVMKMPNAQAQVISKPLGMAK